MGADNIICNAYFNVISIGKTLPKIRNVVVTHGVHLIIPFVLYFHDISPLLEFNAYILQS